MPVVVPGAGEFVLRLLLSLVTGLALLGSGAPALAEGDAVHGQSVFVLCSGCHTLADGSKIGPPLKGVLGRKAGSVAGAHYSAAMSGAGFVWTSAKLGAFLAAPRAVVPGTTMGFSLSDPKARADVIAYLKQAARR